MTVRVPWCPFALLMVYLELPRADGQFPKMESTDSIVV